MPEGEIALSILVSGLLEILDCERLYRPGAGYLIDPCGLQKYIRNCQTKSYVTLVEYGKCVCMQLVEEGLI